MCFTVNRAKNDVTITSECKPTTLFIDAQQVVMCVTDKRLEFNIKQDIDKYDTIVINNVRYIKE